jgi:hypothetical protein
MIQFGQRIDTLIFMIGVGRMPMVGPPSLANPEPVQHPDNPRVIASSDDAKISGIRQRGGVAGSE